jgi:hypothetical protein
MGDRRFGALVLLGMLAGCGPSTEDLVDELAAGGAAGQDAGRELLLAKGEAVPPLLAAFDDPARTGARPYLVPVLFGLMQRTGAPGIESALLRHLASDADPLVRAAIADRLGSARGRRDVAALVDAVGDADERVQSAALKSLSQRDGELDAVQRLRLEGLLPGLLAAADEDLKREALLRAEDTVKRLVDAAQQHVTQADLAAAESLYAAARDFSPSSWMAKFRQARFHYDYRDQKHGLELMRQHGMVLDVPLLEGQPDIDGRLDDRFWGRAAATKLHYQTNYFTAIPALLETQFYIARTAEALYIGCRSADARTDSLVGHRTGRDDQIWMEDSIELFFDANLDRRSYVQFILSHLETVFDAVHEDGIATQQRQWNAADKLATFVGLDFWSLEYRIEFDERWVPRPVPGEVWGANFVRDYRDLVNYSQWVYTYRTVHQPDVFGLLVFR